MAPLSTRILALSGFSSELKTRDLQAVFNQWEDDKGGFRIKWVDDTNALVVFNDAAVAKRAYLHTLMSPPPTLLAATGEPAKLRPYDGEDTAEILSSVQSRTRSRSSIAHASNHSVSHTSQAGSLSVGGGGGGGGGSISPKTEGSDLASGSPNKASAMLSPPSSHASGHRRSLSGSNPSLPAKPVAAALFDAAQGGPSPARHLTNAIAAERAAAEAAAAAKLTEAESTGNPEALAGLERPLSPVSAVRRAAQLAGAPLGSAVDTQDA